MSYLIIGAVSASVSLCFLYIGYLSGRHSALIDLKIAMHRFKNKKENELVSKSFKE